MQSLLEGHPLSMPTKFHRHPSPHLSWGQVDTHTHRVNSAYVQRCAGNCRRNHSTNLNRRCFLLRTWLQ